MEGGREARAVCIMITYHCVPAVTAGGWRAMGLDNPSIRLVSQPKMMEHRKGIEEMMDGYIQLKLDLICVGAEDSELELCEKEYSIARDEAIRIGMDVSTFPKNLVGGKFR